MPSSNNSREATMIDLKYIATIRWTPELGSRLQKLRTSKKLSRYEVERRTIDLGERVAQQYLNQLENPQIQIDRINNNYLTVAIEKVASILNAMDFDLTDLFDSAKIFTATP